MMTKKNRLFGLHMFFTIWLGTPVFSQVGNLAGDSTVVGYVDEVPRFPGGMGAWQRFLRANLDITEAVQAMDSTAYVEYGMRQTAHLEFTVCEDGKVCDIDILNKDNISPEFAKEALRVMKKSPRWIPGRLNDKAVRARFKQSITAVLEL